MASDVDAAILAFMFDEIAQDADKAILNWVPNAGGEHMTITGERWDELLERVGRIKRLASTARDALR